MGIYFTGLRLLKNIPFLKIPALTPPPGITVVACARNRDYLVYTMYRGHLKTDPSDVRCGSNGVQYSAIQKIREQKE